jgi:aspartyl aminopeptidase
MASHYPLDTTRNPERDAFNERLLCFLGRSPTPFHAVSMMASALEAAGFEYLSEHDHWQLDAGGRYYTVRNGSSIVAFTKGTEPVLDKGIRMVGAHTDSPCLMVKPAPDINTREYFKLGVEVYGGALLNPWFDRDLSIAGRVVYREGDTLKQSLVDFETPVAVIPSLAIHLDRQANENRSVNPQTDIPPIIFQAREDRCRTFRDVLAKRFFAQAGSELEILDYDLYCYDVQKPALVGVYEDFIASARIDNLLSCFVGLEALVNSDPQQTCMLVCNDHEEVGSASANGAQGPMLSSVLERLIPDAAERARAISRSLLISADNAHGIHPNYPAKHDDNHGPLLNGGPVVKINARQRYATNSVTSSLFQHLAKEVDVPVQRFVTRTDMACGSTIGPITAAEVGVPTIDVGVPTFAMHSVRELAGVDDACYLWRVLSRFFALTSAPVIDETSL